MLLPQTLFGIPPLRKRILSHALEIVAVLGGIPIRSCFCLLRIILYKVLFGRVNQSYFLVAHPKHV